MYPINILKNKDSYIYKFGYQIVHNQLTSAAAEMAYYLIFAFFPLLMVIHASLSMLLADFDFDASIIFSIVPMQIENLLRSYTEHISKNSNLSFLLLGIILTIYTLSKFMKSLKKAVRRIYCSHNYSMPLADWGVSIVFAVLIIATFYVSLFLLILGEHLFSLIRISFPLVNFSFFQSYFRYIYTAVVICVVVALLYYMIPNVKHSIKEILPGTLFSSASWIIVSGIFSFYMNNFSRYSVIYGSIGAFIMLLLWIYILCLLILLGAVINSLIYDKRTGIISGN